MENNLFRKYTFVDYLIIGMILIISTYIYPNVAEIFGPKALHWLYIRPSRNDFPFSRPHRMSNTLLSLKMVNHPLLTQSIPF